MFTPHRGPTDLTLTPFASSSRAHAPSKRPTEQSFERPTTNPPRTGPRPSGASAPSPARLSHRPNILLISHEAYSREQMLQTLGRAGCSVSSASSRREAHDVMDGETPDLLVVDLDLPDGTGWEMLIRIRSISWVPMIVQSSSGREADKVRALQAGADDYLVKPVSGPELAARVLALLRRAGKIDRPATLETHQVGDITIDPFAREVRKAGAPVALTPTEFRLLVCLGTAPGQLRSTRELLEAAWGDPWGVGGNRVKYAVLRLRKKLEGVGGEPVEIQNRRGYGYRLLVGADAATARDDATDDDADDLGLDLDIGLELARATLGRSAPPNSGGVALDTSVGTCLATASASAPRLRLAHRAASDH